MVSLIILNLLMKNLCLFLCVPIEKLNFIDIGSLYLIQNDGIKTSDSISKRIHIKVILIMDTWQVRLQKSPYQFALIYLSMRK